MPPWWDGWVSRWAAGEIWDVAATEAGINWAQINAAMRRNPSLRAEYAQIQDARRLALRSRGEAASIAVLPAATGSVVRERRVKRAPSGEVLEVTEVTGPDATLLGVALRGISPELHGSGRGPAVQVNVGGSGGLRTLVEAQPGVGPGPAIPAESWE